MLAVLKLGADQHALDPWRKLLSSLQGVFGNFRLNEKSDMARVSIRTALLHAVREDRVALNFVLGNPQLKGWMGAVRVCVPVGHYEVEDVIQQFNKVRMAWKGSMQLLQKLTAHGMCCIGAGAGLTCAMNTREFEVQQICKHMHWYTAVCSCLLLSRNRLSFLLCIDMLARQAPLQQLDHNLVLMLLVVSIE